MNELEKRRRLLVAEADLYRELLKQEIHTLGLHGKVKIRRARDVRTYLMLLFRVASGARMLLTQRDGGRWRIGRLALMGWRAYRRFAPPVRALLDRRARQRAEAARL